MYLKEEKRTTKENLYKLGEKLGLNKNDIDYALKYRKASDEYAPVSFGPGGYPGGSLYGTISIENF